MEKLFVVAIGLCGDARLCSMEEFVVCKLPDATVGWWLKHTFHAVVGHAIIAAIFEWSAQLFIDLVECADATAMIKTKKG